MKKVSGQAAPPRSSLLGGLARGVGRQARPTPTRREWLALRPVRNPALAWRQEEGVVIIEIHRAQNWKTRLLNLVFPLPEHHRVALDAIGTMVWLAADGEATVEHIAKKIAREQQIDRREAELSLQQFFKELGRRGYIAFQLDGAAGSAST